MSLSKHSKKRSFRLEPLEERTLLSATGWEMLEPGGMLAYEYSTSANLSPGMSRSFTFAVDEAADLAVSVTMPAGLRGTATLKSGTQVIGSFPVSANQSNFFSTYLMTDELPTGTYSLDIVLNSGGSSGTVVIDVLANAQWETEIGGTLPNNARTSAQTIVEREFIDVTPAAGKTGMSRTVMVGKLDTGGTDDWYSFSAQANQQIDIQLYAPGCENLTLDLYNASGTLLAKGVASESFQSAVDSYLVGSSATTLYVKVSGAVTTGSIGTGVSADVNGRYTLTIYRNASFESVNNDGLANGESLAGGSLDSTTTGFGAVNGFQADAVTETVLATGSSSFGKAISVDGNSMAVTTCDATTNGRKLTIYEYDGTQWVQKASIAEASAGSSSRYGSSVAFSGEYVIVGALNDTNAAGARSGSVYIYRYTGTSLTLVGKFAPTDLAAGDAFGTSVTISGNTAVVSAPNATVNGVKSGAVYVYQFNGATWNQEAKLAGGANGAASSAVTTVADKGLFGMSVAFDGTYLAVGAPADLNADGLKTGAVYVYARTSAGWTQVSRLLPKDYPENAYTIMAFGEAVAISDGVLAVGTPDYHVSGSNHGGVFVYHLASVTGSGVSTRAAWQQQAILTPATKSGEVAQNFGCSLSVEGGKILVGADSFLKIGTSLVDFGAAFLYEYASVSGAMQWRSAGMLLPGTISEMMAFGGSVALMNGRACVAATNGGSVHLFDNLSDADAWTVNIPSANTNVYVKLYVLGTANSLATGALTAPTVEVYNPSGQLVHTYTASAAGTYIDRYFVSGAAGTYTFVVRAAAGESCQYALEVTNHTSAAFKSLAPLSVEGVSPADGTVVSANPGKLTMQFSQQVLATTLGSATLKQQNGSTITLTNPTLIDGNTVQWTIPASATLVEGSMTVTLTGVRDVRNQTISTTGGANSYAFLYDNTAPTVTTFTQENLPSSQYVPFAQVRFSEAMTENFSSHNITLTGSSTGSRTVIPVYNAATNTLLLCTAGALADDYYTLTLKSGSDGLRDRAGIPLAGSSGAGTDYVKSFFVDTDMEQDLATPLTAVGTAGAMIWSTSAKASLSSAADTDMFAVSALSGQILTVEVVGESVGMKPVITIYNANNPSVPLSVTSVNNGTSTAVTMPYSVTSSGTYIIKVSSESGGATGVYTIQAVINASVERPTANQTRQTAQALTFWNVNSSATIRQAAVLGTLDTTADSDFYSFQLQGGYKADITLADEYAGAVFAVYDSGGNLIATSMQEEGGTRQVVHHLKNQTTGTLTYYVKVFCEDPTGQGDGNYASGYQLVVTRNAMLEAQGNDAVNTAQDLSVTTGVVGTVTSPVVSANTAALDVAAVDTSPLTTAQLNSLGSSVAVSGDWAVVGGGNYAAIYQFSGGAWQFYQLLLPGVVAGNENFAASVAISGNTLVLGSTGAYQQTAGGQGSLRTGAVYIYQLSGTQWKLESAFSPTDAEYADLFGHALAIQGDTIAVSAVRANEPGGGNSDTGAVYILQRTASGWRQTAKITAGDASRTEYFGYSLSLEGDMLVVGAISDYGTNAGKAYVYRNVDGHWIETAVLSPTSQAGACFGANVQISGQWMAVSAPAQTVSGQANAGAVYVYRYNSSTGTWLQYATLTAKTPTANAFWGTQMALDGASLFVASAPAETLATASVECFMRVTGSIGSYGTWTSQWVNTVAGSGEILLGGGAERLLTVYPQRQAGATQVEAWSKFRDVDYYSFTAVNNTRITLDITAIADGSTMTAGKRPLVEVFAADGTNISNLSGDNYSATLSFTPTAGTTYYVRVTAQSGDVCNYALNLSAFTASELNAKITGTTPAVGTSIPAGQGNSILVHFSENVDISTVAANYAGVSLTVGGNNHACTSYEIVDGKTVRFTFNTASMNAEGTVVVTVPEVFKDLTGKKFAQYLSAFSVDTTAPTFRYSSLYLRDPFFVHNSLTTTTSLTLFFSEKLNTQVIQASDFLLTGAVSGDQIIQGISFSEDGTGTLVTLDFGVLPQDFYSLTINPAGSGVPDGAGNPAVAFEETFAVVYRTAVALDHFEKIVIPGSMAYEAADSGYLLKVGTNGSGKSYTLTVSPNQTVSVSLAMPEATAANILVTYADGTPGSVGTTSSYSNGVWTVVFHSDRNATRKYNISITNNTTGDDAYGAVYDLAVTLNGMQEIEMLSPAEKGVNDTPATAQNLTPVFHAMNAIDATATSAAVKGTLSDAADVDWYRFNIADGATFSVMLTDSLPGNISLELYGMNSAGDAVRILRGVPTTETDAWIGPVTDVADGTAGTFYLKVSRAGDQTAGEESQLANFFAEYGILIVQNATFNQEPNETLPTAQPTDRSQGDTTYILGYLSNNGVDKVLTEEAILSAETTRGAMVGQSVATTGDIILVGSPGSNQAGEASGAVAIYQYDGTKWYLAGHLEGDDVAYFDQFGASVAISGNTAVVSATGRVNNDGTTGAVYVFDYSEAGWTQTAVLTSPNNDDGIFGFALDISGNRLVVGSPGTTGAAYVYVREGTSGVWSLKSTLQNLNTGTANSQFGSAVAISGTTILVGAPAQSVTSGATEYAKAGVAYVYEYSSGTWSPSGTLTAQTPQAGAMFGYALDLADGRLSIGAPGETVSAQANSGAVYIFTKSGGQWAIQQRITQSTAAAGDYFGCSLALDGDSLLVGAYGNDHGGSTDAGAAWMFTFSGGTWSQKGKVVSGNAAAYDGFGMSVAMTDGTVVVGAPLASTDVTGTDGSQHAIPTGTAHIFQDVTDVDCYALTVNANREIVVTMTIPGAPSDAVFQNLLQHSVNTVKLYSGGVSLTPTSYADGRWVFSPLTNGQPVILVVSADAGRNGEYILEITGNRKTTTPAPPSCLSLTTTPANSPAEEITLVFDQAVRGDLVNLGNITVNTGTGTVSPTGIRVSEDGKTVTLLMPTGVPYTNAKPTITIQPNTFANTAGDWYGSKIEGSFNVVIKTVDIYTQVTTTDHSTSVTWIFGEAMNFGSIDLAEAIKVLDSGGHNLVDVEALEISESGTSITWTYSQALDNGAGLTTQLDGKKLCANSGAILAGMAQADAGVVTRDFVLDHDSSVEAALVVSTAATNSALEVSKLPASVAWVDEWSTVWVEVWGRVVSDDNTGLADFHADIVYDTSLFVPATKSGGAYDFSASSAFSGSRGELHVFVDEAGVLRISGTTTQSGIGDNGQYVLIGRVKFTPSASGTGAETGVNLNFATKEFAGADSGFDLGNVSATTTGGVKAVDGTALARENVTAVYAVPYDLNDSGSVDIYDLIQFAKAYGQPASSTTSQYAWVADFDGNGKVDIYDLIQFAKNYGKSRTNGGVTIPGGITEDWGYYVEGEMPAPDFAAMVAEEAVFLTEEEADLLRSLGFGGLVSEEMIRREEGVAEMEAEPVAKPVAAVQPEIAVVLTTADEVVLDTAIAAPMQGVDTVPPADITLIRFPKNVLASDIGNVKWMDMNAIAPETVPETDAAVPRGWSHAEDVPRQRIFADELFSGEDDDDRDDDDLWMFAAGPRRGLT